jgi:hypothetical protein
MIKFRTQGKVSNTFVIAGWQSRFAKKACLNASNSEWTDIAVFITRKAENESFNIK